MNKHVGVSELETNLSALLDEVENGGEVTITRHGKPVAKLIKARGELSSEEIEKRREAIRNLRAMARELKISATQEEIKSWINEGRRL